MWASLLHCKYAGLFNLDAVPVSGKQYPVDDCAGSQGGLLEMAIYLLILIYSYMFSNRYDCAGSQGVSLEMAIYLLILIYSYVCLVLHPKLNAVLLGFRSFPKLSVALALAKKVHWFSRTQPI